MPFWHDPFDELIAALERATPVAPAAIDDIPPFEHIQLVVCRLLFGDADAPTPPEDDRIVKEVWAYFERLAAQRRST
jgi:hypothetical protein